MKFLSILILLIVLISCISPEKKQDNRININPNTTEVISLDKLVAKIEIVPLVTSDTSLISTVRKISYWNNELYIFDRNQKQVMKFDLNGKFIQKLNCIGRGPGEYLDISDFAINPYNNNIEIVDGYNLYVYDSTFQFVEKIIIPKEKIHSVNNLEIINKNQILFLANGKTYIPAIYFRQTNKIVRLPEIYPKWLIEKMPFNTIDRIYRNGSIINYIEGFSNKVYSVNENGFELKYEWNFGDFNFDYMESSLSNLIQSSTIQDIMKNSELFMDKYIISFRHSIENEHFILTSFFLKKQPTTLLYNKNTGKYNFFDKKLSLFLFTSLVDFVGIKKIIVVAEPEKIKNLPQEWFSILNQEKINAIDPLSNPVVLIFHLKPNLLENDLI